ncbi:hypothetical protein [Usitatibacter palustris]|uniref:Uncharacterized protein n=1 Tax=Usitatibacter palustris TaxID=2732487 RepID=A0A6M4HDE5_9PROT|nr:hypothetical protein [Usitatibacter palustris]QJR16007.1 hypothetical protein DSM104440_02835 [Usitatibacter palustris]
MTLRFVRRLAAVFALSFAASASTIHSPDFTDMWWNAAESGWGINIVQQNNTIFATWFVYGPDGKPKWYVASGMLPESSPTGFVFQGDLYETNGPWFGGPFTPAPTNQSVGTARLSFSSASTATLTYNAGTTSVSKSITRYTFQNTTPVGLYYPAGISIIASGCSNSSSNGARYALGLMTATVNGSLVTFRVTINDSTSCTFAGTLVQDGRFASVSAGTWSCTAGSTVTNGGNFTLGMLDIQIQHLTATITGNDQSCAITGRFGGLRDVVN